MLTYESWKADCQSWLSKLSDKQIILMYSGGKDSSVALHLLLRAADEFDFKFEAHSGVFPQHVLTHEEIARLDSYWMARGAPITWHTVQTSDEALGQALVDGVSPCLICNRAKKTALMNYLKRGDYDWSNLVIVMSYSLWDLVSATVEHLTCAVYSGSDATGNLQGKSTEERFLETSQRFFPWLRMKSGLTIFKPLIRYNDQCILKTISDHSIPVTNTNCRYREYRPKRLFAEHYKKLNLQFDYDKVFKFACRALSLPEISYFENQQHDTYLKLMI